MGYNELRVMFLGTGAGWPSRHRNVSSLALLRSGEAMLFDCGEGTQRQIMHTTLSPMRVSRVFITHAHGDHFLGLPGLVQSMCLNERTEPMEVFVPEAILSHMEVLVRVGHPRQTFPIRIRGIEPGFRLDADEYSIEAFAADHIRGAMSFVIAEKDRPGRFDRPTAEAIVRQARCLTFRIQISVTPSAPVTPSTSRPPDVRRAASSFEIDGTLTALLITPPTR